MGFDPVTAALNAAFAFFTFAATPAGQQILTDLRALNSAVANDIGKLISVVAAHAPMVSAAQLQSKAQGPL